MSVLTELDFNHPLKHLLPSGLEGASGNSSIRGHIAIGRDRGGKGVGKLTRGLEIKVTQIRGSKHKRVLSSILPILTCHALNRAHIPGRQSIIVNKHTSKTLETRLSKSHPDYSTRHNLPTNPLFTKRGIIRAGRCQFLMDQNNHTTRVRKNNPFLLTRKGKNNVGFNILPNFIDKGNRISMRLKNTNHRIGFAKIG